MRKPHGAERKPNVVQLKDATGNTHDMKAKHNTALMGLPEDVLTALIQKAGMWYVCLCVCVCARVGRWLVFCVCCPCMFVYVCARACV